MIAAVSVKFRLETQLCLKRALQVLWPVDRASPTRPVIATAKLPRNWIAAASTAEAACRADLPKA